MIYLTTTKLAEKLGIEKRQCFSMLSEHGWIERKNNKWVLTTLGQDEGGQVRSAPETGEFVVWPENVNVPGSEAPNDTKSKVIIVDENGPSESSEGEDYIAEYLDAIGIEYRKEHLIEGLEDKHASHRKGDFYLPKYKVWVEFAGGWNRSQEERERYRIKKEVYRINRIPCIWIYPDNLGVLHYFFHKRLESVLGNFGLERGLLRYRLLQFWKEDSGNFVGVIFGLFLLFYGVTPWKENTAGVWISLALISYNLYHIVHDLVAILKGKSIKISRLNKWEE